MRFCVVLGGALPSFTVSLGVRVTLIVAAAAVAAAAGCCCCFCLLAACGLLPPASCLLLLLVLLLLLLLLLLAAAISARCPPQQKTTKPCKNATASPLPRGVFSWGSRPAFLPSRLYFRITANRQCHRRCRARPYECIGLADLREDNNMKSASGNHTLQGTLPPEQLMI